jgi:hypothetical protein
MSRSLGNLVVKDPQSDEPWGMDWTDFVDELGVSSTIATSTWTITRTDGQPSDLSMHDASFGTTAYIDGQTQTGHFTQVYLAGGTRGRKYRVTNEIVTNNTPPVTDERSFFVLVQDR